MWKHLATAVAVVLIGSALDTVAQRSEPPAGTGLRVERAVIALGVEDREPVGAAKQFAASVGRLTCFTEIVDAHEPTHILHVWRHAGVERARIELRVHGARWRTWSSKQIVPAWSGDWEVEVQDAQGTALQVVRFTVNP